jgi:chorismate dehydratase
MLFSKEGWSGLDGKTIGVTDETATSVVLLRLLLEKRYGVKARFSRMHGGVNDCSAFDAVLLIGDQALVHNRRGLAGFELVFDLAREWYDWKKMPFVFAVWAVKRSLAEPEKSRIADAIGRSLEQGEENLESLGAVPGRSLGLETQFVEEYLEGFSYRLGDREKEAVDEFRRLVAELEPEHTGASAS